MAEIIRTNYYWGQDVQMSQFYRVPKALYTSECFRCISYEAKAIYGMMIDRVTLSIKNKWLDDEGKNYIHYSVAEIMEDMGCGKNKVVKCLKELEEVVGLIERKKQGQGKPDMIYVKNFVIEDAPRSLEDEPLEVYDANLKEFTNETSRSPECKPLEVCNSNPNNTENNYNNINNTNPILSINQDGIDGMDEYRSYSELVKKNIELDVLLDKYPYDKEQLQEIYDLIVEAVVAKGDTVPISGQKYPRSLVKAKLLKLDMSHIEYVLSCLQNSTTEVRNIKAYMLAALFNAGATMVNYYRAKVNHDMAG